MIPYGRQSIDDEDIRAVTEALRSDWLTQGPRAEEFEHALSSACGARHAVVFSSGTTALQAAYSAAGLGPGDEILTSPITFAATANAAVWLGGIPVFADIDPRTGQLDPAEAERLLTSRTKVLAPVDFAGHSADWDALRDIARRHDVLLVADACHALGASYKGRRIGSLADMTVFSFHPVKSITTGEGGAVVTDSGDRHARLLRFRQHGMAREGLLRPSPGAWYHEMQGLGVNGRLTDFQCALGLSQLRKLEKFVARRRLLARRYLEALKEVPGIRPLAPERIDDSAWHLFVVLLEGALDGRRGVLFKGLREAGVGVQVHYMPVYRHPYYEQRGYPPGLCPRAEEFSSRALSLPLFPDLSEDEQDRVVASLKRALSASHESSHTR